jgi:hypothetical protein
MMQNAFLLRWAPAAVLAAAIPLGPAIADAQGSGGSARAVQATIVTSTGLETSMLADTGTLSSATDARDASQPAGSVGSIVSAQTLHASAIASDDRTASESSLAGLTVSVDGTSVSASFVQARATSGQRGVRTSTINDLTINGVPITVTGAVNQTIAIAGGVVVINEQSGSVVNALHIVKNGVADVVIASANASAQ